MELAHERIIAAERGVGRLVSTKREFKLTIFFKYKLPWWSLKYSEIFRCDQTVQVQVEQ